MVRKSALTPLIVFLATILFSGCASGPRFDTKEYEEHIAPTQAARDIEQIRGKRVLWGGVIINLSNLEKGTELEILGYPLRRSQIPDTREAPLGRFVIHSDEYLESVDFAQGRLLTVAGPVIGTREGTIGQARYLYPVVEADAGHLYLWPADVEDRIQPHLSIGVGILFGH
jgi:outer membrane lipoprotein